MNWKLNHVHRLVLVLAAITASVGAAWLLSGRHAIVHESFPVPIGQVTSDATPEMPPQGGPPIIAITSNQAALQQEPEDMTSSASDLHEITPARTVARQVDMSGLPTHGPGGMGIIRGLIVCEPTGSYDFQDLLVEIDSKRVKAECEIDDQGRFTADNLPPGRYSIYVREALALYQILCPGVQVQIDTSQPEYEVALQVGKPATVTILAQKQGIGQRISGLAIRVRSVTGPAQTASTTNPEGQCEFELAPGQYLVETTVFMNGQSVQIEPEPLTVPGHGHALQCELSIPAPPPVDFETMEFLLVDSIGSPLSGIITGMNTEPQTQFVLQFYRDEYPGERYIGSIGQAYDVSGTLARRFLYKPEPHSSMKIVLEQQAVITGRVVDPNGQPIQEVYLGLETLLSDGSIQREYGSFYRLSQEEDGRFVFTDVSIGLPVKVAAVAPGRSQGRSRVLNLKPAQTTDVGDIIVPPRNGVITGWATDENGSPIPKCRIQGDHTTLTNKEGQFTLERLPKDEDIRITIDLPGYGQWSKTTRADDHSFALQIFPEGWQVIGNQAPPLFAAQWWNSRPVSLKQTRGKVVVLALGADPFIDTTHGRPPFISYAEPLMDIHRRFSGTKVQIIIMFTPVNHQSTMDMERQDLENAYLEVDDLSFAACVDEDPKLVAQLQPEGSRSRGATYTLYQARRPNTVVLIDKKGIVRAYPSTQDLNDWVQRLVEE